jgi:hypothetical protein
MDLRKPYAHEGIRQRLKKYYFHIILLICFALLIALLIVFDYLNIESFLLFNEKFIFEETWKGRVFYLFFNGCVSRVNN